MKQHLFFRFTSNYFRFTRTLPLSLVTALLCLLTGNRVFAQCDANFAGTYANAAGTSTITVSGNGSLLTAKEVWASGGRSGTNTWSNCMVTGNTIKCDWNGDYKGDPDKTADRSGTLTATISGDTLTGNYLEDAPKFHWNVAPYPSAMREGAKWPLNHVRKGGAPSPCAPVAPRTPNATRATIRGTKG